MAVTSPLGGESRKTGIRVRRQLARRDRRIGMICPRSVSVDLLTHLDHLPYDCQFGTSLDWNRTRVAVSRRRTNPKPSGGQPCR